MKLNEIRDNAGARKSRVRVGRGEGSGRGKTCGRGHKGQKSRSGVSVKGFEGGQNPIYMRLPKRGFNNDMFALNFAVVNLGDLQRAVDAGKLDAKKEIALAELQAAGLVRSSAKRVKLLAKGELKSALKLVVDRVSETAKVAVEKAKGAVTILMVAAAEQDTTA